MRRFWAVDTKTLSLDGKAIHIEAKRKPRMAEGDQVVLYERSYNEVLFTAHTAISQSIEVAKDPEKTEKRLFKLEIKTPVPFDNKLGIDEFAFSLTIVYRFRTPYRHFVRSYRSLPSFDFDTLFEQRIYWSRTAFGHFVNALTADQYASFIASLSREDISVAIQTATPKAAWDSMKKFIRTNYLAAAKLLQAVERDATSLSQVIAFDKVGLQDPDSNRIDNVAKQTQLLSSLYQNVSMNEKETTLFDEIDMMIEEDIEYEHEFAYQFSEEPWPYQPERKR